MTSNHSTEAIGLAHMRHRVCQGFALRILDQDGETPGAETVYRARAARATIGTHKSVDCLLGDKAVSRFHCEISVDDDQGLVRIRDLGSRNGTFVDGVQVESARLKDGAVLTLGKTRLRFELGRKEVRVPLSERERFGHLVGQSAAMRTAFLLLEQAAKSRSTLLVQGETGTGKDLAAESVHLEGGRADAPFVVVDCGAVSANLLDDELFGHEQGAFTGASQARPGAFELAHGGTIFLDEVGELSLELQPKLLRVLESRVVKRIGGPHSQARPVDVHIIAATNRNLRAMVNERTFRSDLYYRLVVLDVRLPSLRERLDDLPLLVDELLRGLGAANNEVATTLRSDAFLAELRRHDWQGNVRELKNYLERCLSLQRRLPIDALGDPSDARWSTLPVDITMPLPTARETWVRTFERRYLEELLRAHDGNVSRATRAAGVDRAYFYRLLSRCGLR